MPAPLEEDGAKGRMDGWMYVETEGNEREGREVMGMAGKCRMSAVHRRPLRTKTLHPLSGGGLASSSPPFQKNRDYPVLFAILTFSPCKSLGPAPKSRLHLGNLMRPLQARGGMSYLFRVRRIDLRIQWVIF